MHWWQHHDISASPGNCALRVHTACQTARANVFEGKGNIWDRIRGLQIWQTTGHTCRALDYEHNSISKTFSTMDRLEGK